MMDDIRRRFEAGEYEYSLHAVDQSVVRRIRPREVEQAVRTGAVIEDYPTDKYGPSCLILGGTEGRRST